MEEEKKMCPFCGQTYVGIHACPVGQSYSMDTPFLNKPAVEKEAAAPDGTVYREAPSSQKPSFACCDMCGVMKASVLLQSVSLKLNPQLATMLGSSVKEILVCPECLEKAYDVPWAKAAKKKARKILKKHFKM